MLCWIVGFRHYFGDFTPFKTAATYPFFLWKNYTNDWFPCNTLLIKIVFPIPTSLTFWFQIVRIWIFRFLNWRYIYKVGPAYWLALTLDSSPRYDKWIITFYSSFIVYYLLNYLQPNKMGFLVEQNKPCRAKSILISIENGGCKNPHKWSLPSSRTLLSTTSFQTKFYHNIPLISNRDGIDSIWNHE